jgi:DNA-binding response OmpR family regulator
MTLIHNRPSPVESAPDSQAVLATASAELAERVTEALDDPHTSLVVIGSLEELDARDAGPDLLILDGATPDIVAERAVKRLRRRWLSMLIVAIRVADEAASSALLETGVDDAIEARHDWSHVAARLKASARRTRTSNAMLRRRVGDVVYDRENRRVWCAGTEVEFSPRELAVLDALWIRAGELVRHDSLQDYVWAGIDEGERSNRLEVYISYIRRKLAHSREVTIQTLRGAGYRLVRKSATDTPWMRDEEE